MFPRREPRRINVRFRRTRQPALQPVAAKRAARAAATLEPLESRRLLTMTVGSVTADNRGEVQIILNSQADPKTVTRTSVQMYTAGDDGKLGTKDDVKVRAPVGWSANAKRITVRGNLPADTIYRVRLVSSRLLDLNGDMLDGDFKGFFPTGNRREGGNFEFKTQTDVSDTPTVRMNTTSGVINLKMLRKQKPITVQNFLSYSDSGRYDNIPWTRSVPNFVIQSGALQIDSTNTIVKTETDAPIVNEFEANGVVSNRRGTVAFAKLPGDPDSATNEFFFNLNDNGGDGPYSLDVQNGGFTVFAKLADVLSYGVVDAIAFYQTAALHNPLTGDGVLPDFSPVNLTDVPLQDVNALPDGEVQTVEEQPEPLPSRTQYVVKSGLDPSENLVIVKRTATLMKVVRT